MRFILCWLNFARTENSGWKISNIEFRFEAKRRLILCITRKGKFLLWDPTTSDLIWRCYERKCFENVDYYFNLSLSCFCLQKRKKTPARRCDEGKMRPISWLRIKRMTPTFIPTSSQNVTLRTEFEKWRIFPLLTINTNAWFQERRIDAGNTA